jgi:hypothetical protein
MNTHSAARACAKRHDIMICDYWLMLRISAEEKLKAEAKAEVKTPAQGWR